MDYKWVGEESEINFALQAIRRGFVVAKPYGENSTYDFVVDYRGQISRVQVKSTSRELPNEEKCKVNISCGNRKNRRGYETLAVDFIAVHVRGLDLWYIIPTTEVARKKTLTLRPRADNISKFNQYEEAWHLMQQ